MGAIKRWIPRWLDFPISQGIRLRKPSVRGRTAREWYQNLPRAPALQRGPGFEDVKRLWMGAYPAEYGGPRYSSDLGGWSHLYGESDDVLLTLMCKKAAEADVSNWSYLSSDRK